MDNWLRGDTCEMAGEERSETEATEIGDWLDNPEQEIKIRSLKTMTFQINKPSERWDQLQCSQICLFIYL